MSKWQRVILFLHNTVVWVWENIGVILAWIAGIVVVGLVVLFVVWAVTSQTNQQQNDCNVAKATVHAVAKDDPQDLNKVTDMMVAICND
jgi:hypothetical protein